jgi:antirestriction protein ArdC
MATDGRALLKRSAILARPLCRALMAVHSTANRCTLSFPIMATATATKTRKARPVYDGPSADEKLVAQLVELMNAGVNPWRKEWTGQQSSRHINLATGKPYQGCNPAVLQFQMAARGSTLALWCGLAQAKKNGWYPVKGSKGCYILRPQLNSRIQQDEDGRTIRDENGDPVIAQWISYRPACVFNVADLKGDGLEDAIAKYVGTIADRPEDERLRDAAAALKAWPVKVTHGGDRACYSPAIDRINMPARKAFTNDAAYYATLAHECIHSTGHKSRLARDFGGVFGDDKYAREELVAELGAFLLCQRLEISSSTENHAAYLHHWAKVLGEGPKVLFKVLSDATKAAGMIVPESIAADEPTGDA